MHVPITFLWRVYKNSRFSPSHLDSLWVPICVFAAKSLQLCPTLCNPIDGSPPGSAILEILQARIVEWVAIFFSNEVTQSCLTLSDPMDGSLPGSSIHGIFQARVLEWGAIAFSVCVCSHMLFSYTYFPNIYLFVQTMDEACRILVPWPGIEPWALSNEITES